MYGGDGDKLILLEYCDGKGSEIVKISLPVKDRLNKRTSLIDPEKNSPLLRLPFEPRRRVDDNEIENVNSLDASLFPSTYDVRLRVPRAPE